MIRVYTYTLYKMLNDNSIVNYILILGEWGGGGGLLLLRLRFVD